ncbi:MAG: hypothetical protein ACP5ER_01295 [Candidatus Bathyarchaeales archaeon]
MSIEPVEHIMKIITNRYNKNPKGWDVLADQRGNVLILGPNVGYRLRLIPLNPREYTGVGVQMTEPAELKKNVKGFPSYGLRPVSKTDTKQLFNAISRFGTVPQTLIKKLFGAEPVPTWHLNTFKPGAVLNGPVTFSPNLNTIVKGQRELERKLEIEAYKLFKQKHPSRASFYGW